jgi:hypothetical protein
VFFHEFILSTLKKLDYYNAGIEGKCSYHGIGPRSQSYVRTTLSYNASVVKICGETNSMPRFNIFSLSDVKTLLLTTTLALQLQIQKSYLGLAPGSLTWCA